MTKTYKALFVLSLLLLTILNLKAQDKLLDIMSDELNRNFSELKLHEMPPYFISYRIEDVKTFSVSASFGNITSSSESNKRTLTVQTRVGDKTLDNFHELRDNYSDFMGDSYEGSSMPLDDNPIAVKQSLWLETDMQYKKAIDRFSKVKANVAVKIESEDKAVDYSVSKIVNYIELAVNPDDIIFNRSQWEERVKKYSKLFLNDPDIFNSTVAVSYTIRRKYFVSSDGSKIAENEINIRIFVEGTIQAKDGMDLPLYRSYYAFKPEELPSDELLTKDVQALVSKLTELKNAPMADAFTGPAILTGEAAGVFFHEIFGHRVEGQRQKQESDAQTFKRKIGQEVLPADLTVIFDPTIKKYRGFEMNGFYVYDDEGVKSEKVVVVDKGILKDFLMSKCPIDSFPKSNGHGRAAAGKQPVTRQSNLIVETSKPYSIKELRQMLIDEAKKQGKEYGYLFKTVEGGFTMTGRYVPNSFNITPLEVYRIYVDGRPDELVRGVDMVGTPLAMFSEIVAAGEDAEVFNGTCGAESGGVPVSSVTPSLFVKKVETQRKAKEQDRPPVLPRPDISKPQ
jgi:predicted Zn-dependent protease